MSAPSGPLLRLVFLILVGVPVLGLIPRLTTHSFAAVECRSRPIMNVVAHQDDDLLFINPEISRAIARGRCVDTVYVTAGDAGQSSGYWQAREAGVRAAYAVMARVPDQWQRSDAVVAGHRIVMDRLSGAGVRLFFLRLPDGSIPGTGYRATGYQSLQKLWTGRINRIDSIDGRSSYTRSQLVEVLAGLIDLYRPTTLRTLNALGSFGDGDHSDHVAVGRLTLAAQHRSRWPVPVRTYLGYTSRDLPRDLGPARVTEKREVFFAYENVVHGDCISNLICGWYYPALLERTYPAGLFGAPGTARTVGSAP